MLCFFSENERLIFVFKKCLLNILVWVYCEATVLAGQEATVRTRHEQETGSKLGKEYVKAIYGHLAYLIYMQSTSCEMLGWMDNKLESRLSGEISIISDMQMMAESEEELKSFLMKVKEETEKAGLKLYIQKMKIIASSPITYGKQMGKQWK